MENVRHHEPWNKGKLIGQKRPLKQKDLWAIRIPLQLNRDVRTSASVACIDVGVVICSLSGVY